ncbi:MAG TPA: FMN-binding protein [Devosia sp.]
MNKIALSLLVVASSGVYIWDQSHQHETAAPLDALLASDISQASEATAASPGSSTVAATTTPATTCVPAGPDAVPAEVPSTSVPRAEITNAAMTTAAGKGMSDGTYTGPTTDAYYGPMQIEAVVQNGKLVTLRALQYPSDRRTSLVINRQALPMLRDEAIAAQSADVDIITGATLTSKAFIRSLAGALAQAGR